MADGRADGREVPSPLEAWGTLEERIKGASVLLFLDCTD